MAVRAGAVVPLLARPAEALLFLRPEGAVTAAAFLAGARRLADTLPEGTAPVLNLCADRYHFALGFAACLLRGRVSLLTGDRTPARIAALAERFPGLLALAERPCQLPVPVLPLALPPDADRPAWRAGMPAAMPLLPATQPAAIVFTSGSTGEPVGHAKSWGALAARSVDAGRRFRLRPEAPAAVIGTVPPQHMYGFETTVLLGFHAAAASWCGPAFYPVDVVAALGACAAPRVLVTTPLQLRALLAAAPPPGAPPIGGSAAIAPGLLARVISATAPLDPALAAAAERHWQTEVWEIFGATEVGSIATRRTVAGPLWRSYPRVRLDPPAGAGGRIAARAPFAAPFPLNDRLELQDPTRFRLLGRDSDLVKLGGRRASLAGLSLILTGIAGVEDGVFVAPDDLETRPTARLLAYAVAPDLPAEAILAALRRRIDPLFLPRRVVRLERLPRDALGKLPAGALHALRLGAEAAAAQQAAAAEPCRGGASE